LVIRVVDTGRGIAPEHQARLFEPFYQADTSTTRTFGGTGLGLALSKRLAQALGGELRLVESAPGKGSAFELRFSAEAGAQPAMRPEPQSEETSDRNEGAGASEPRTALKDVRVLLVEDSADNQALISRILRSSGASVDLADNGDQALRMAKPGVYDVVLMDLQMPVRDGFETTAELRRRGFDRPILAVSAAAMREERDRALRVGCDDHVTKPINAPALVRKVREHAMAAIGLH
jgi:CheY-like chemotaxis protein